MFETMNRYGRVGEIFHALLKVAPSDEIQDELKDFALGVFQEQREEEASSLEAEVVRAIVTCLDQVVGDRLPIKAITEEVNEERDEKDSIKPQKVGWILARLGFKKARMPDAKGSYAIVTDRDLIDRLAATYDVKRTETLSTLISPKSCSDAQLLRDHIGETSLGSEHSEQLSNKGKIGEPSDSSFNVETTLPETSTASRSSAPPLNCKDEEYSVRDLVLGRLRTVKGPMSWDYAVEQAMKVTGDRTKAEGYLKRFQDEGLLAKDPDGYWRLTK